MDTLRGWRTSLLALAVTTAACGTQDRLPLEPPSRSTQSQTQTVEISGDILGPDGTSICNSVPAQEEIFVVAFPEDPSQPFPAEGDLVVCPDDSYSIAAEPGTYILHTDFFPWDDLGELPVQTVLPPLAVEEDVVQDIRIEEGSPLRGHATLDGQPFPGVAIFPVNQLTYGFGAAGASASNGRWQDAVPTPPFDPFLVRRPMFLQEDLEYLIFGECFAILGTLATEVPPFEPFIFPTQRQRVDCTLETAATTQLTHNFNRIAVTPLPGDIGGLSDPSRLPELGFGYGVQFPTTPGQAPAQGDRGLSEMFMGGLMIGIGPQKVLSGVSVDGYMECRGDLENSCRDLGLDGTVKVFSSPKGRKTVAWRYSDAPSAEGVGLRILQRSFDAPAGNEYVLFQFIIRNHSGVRRTITPGIFADLDVDLDAFEDVGFVQRNGRLLSMSSAFEGTTTRVGTLMFGETPPTQGHFFYGFPFFNFLTLTQQLHALKGTLSAAPSDPGDLRYIQSVQPVTLRIDGQTTLWVAVIAGENAAAFTRNADAAAEDIRARRLSQQHASEDQGAAVELGPFTASSAAPAAARPVCGKDCLLKLKQRRAPSPITRQR